jgi:hypothetical protein
VRAAEVVPEICRRQGLQPLKARDWLASLQPPSDRRRLLVLGIAEFHALFDAIAVDVSRAAVDALGDAFDERRQLGARVRDGRRDRACGCAALASR